MDITVEGAAERPGEEDVATPEGGGGVEAGAEEASAFVLAGTVAAMAADGAGEATSASIAMGTFDATWFKGISVVGTSEAEPETVAVAFRVVFGGGVDLAGAAAGGEVSGAAAAVSGRAAGCVCPSAAASLGRLSVFGGTNVLGACVAAVLDVPPEAAAAGSWPATTACEAAICPGSVKLRDSIVRTNSSMSSSLAAMNEKVMA